MVTSHVQYSLLFSSESVCQAAKNQQNNAKKKWNETNIESALNMCREGKSICGSAKASGISEGTLPNRFIKMQEEGRTLVRCGRKMAIVEQKEKQSDCIKTVCNVGFSPSLHKIKGLV